MCFQRHRPIRKVERSPTMIIGCLILNAVIIVAFYLSCLQNLKERDTEELIGISVACFFFVTSFVTFMSSIFVQPGYMKPSYDVIWLVDNFLETNVHLDNLCIFCEVIKSDSSFHCTICNKCSANYDHHCPFIDNCLGTINHKYFLLFLLNYFIYTLIIIVGASYRFHLLLNDNKGVYSDTWYTLIMFLLVILPLPVLSFQMKEQCRNLNKPPVESQITESRRSGGCNCWTNVLNIFTNKVEPNYQ